MEDELERIEEEMVVDNLKALFRHSHGGTD
jgi:hypothetical protein